MSGHPPWGAVTGVAILLTAAGLAAGALTARSASEDDIAEQRVTGQKISSGLVALSSAAILAVYAAGYHRTGSAADRFDAQTARRKTAAPISAGLVAATLAPSAAVPEVKPIPAVPRTAPPPPRIASAPPSTPRPQPVPAPVEGTPATPSAPPEASANNEPTAPASDAVNAEAKYKDGTYLAWGSCRHGDLQVSVVIQGGKIASAQVAQCLTRYSCSWISNLPGQVIARQSPNVDYVSGATQSSDAFSDAVSYALAKAHE